MRCGVHVMILSQKYYIRNSGCEQYLNPIDASRTQNKPDLTIYVSATQVCAETEKSLDGTDRHVVHNLLLGGHS
jgi:hypothetical protein